MRLRNCSLDNPHYFNSAKWKATFDSFALLILHMWLICLLSSLVGDAFVKSQLVSGMVAYRQKTVYFSLKLIVTYFLLSLIRTLWVKPEISRLAFTALNLMSLVLGSYWHRQPRFPKWLQGLHMTQFHLSGSQEHLIKLLLLRSGSYLKLLFVVVERKIAAFLRLRLDALYNFVLFQWCLAKSNYSPLNFIGFAPIKRTIFTFWHLENRQWLVALLKCLLKGALYWFTQNKPKICSNTDIRSQSVFIKLVRRH